MSKYKKVTISLATSTAEDQAWMVKFIPLEKYKLEEEIAYRDLRWIEINTNGRNAYWDKQDSVWKLAERQDTAKHYVQLSLVTDIHVEEVEVQEP